MKRLPVDADPSMHFRNHYQNAYVTRDLDKAISLTEVRYGVRGLVPVDLELDVVTPAGEAKLCMRLAYAWVGRMQIELIQPLSGCVDHYVDSLPRDGADHSLRFNHIAMRRDSLEELYAEIETSKLPLLFEGRLEGLRYLYLDARRDLGHILEYVWATPETWEFLGWPPDG
jgi:hypothetical protein